MFVLFACNIYIKILKRIFLSASNGSQMELDYSEMHGLRT